MLDNRLDQPSKFRIENWVETNNESRGVYTTGSNIKFKTTMLRSSLCDYADAYILVKGNELLLELEMMLLQDKQMKEINV